MGSGSSHSIALGPPRSFHQSSYHHQDLHRPKFAHPQNRVLPRPVLGQQRLRSTDNGSILQAAGTIRGGQASARKEESTDSEVADVLRRRSEKVEKENYSHFDYRNHRLFHSDPNIARRANGYSNEDIIHTNRRSSQGGAALRASKLKQHKKKTRAPDPPMSNYIRHMERRNQSQDRNSPNCKCLGNGVYHPKENKNCRCINVKNRAPQPPSIVVHPPPPPPPLPNSTTTRTYAENSKVSNHDHMMKSPIVTRAVETRSGYEKNVHPLEKWRNYRSSGDIRIDEEDPLSYGSRTTVFDSKKVVENQGNKIPSYIPLHKPDPFQKEIQAVTRKIAQSREMKQVTATSPTHPKPPETEKKEQKNSPPKFYFADPSVFKMDNHVNQIQKSNQIPKEVGAPETNQTEIRKRLKTTTVDEIVPSLERFSPARRRFKSPSRNSTPDQEVMRKNEREWEDLSKNLYSRNRDSDIDIRLRPVLPLKSPDVPKFSPTEAWQALGSDGRGSSNHSTSDDSFLPAKYFQHRRFSEHNYENNRPFPAMHRSISDSHWTPRQDLLDDSDDITSDDSEDAVVPRIRPGEISTRFSLPTVMFSNMRPIGASNPNIQTSYQQKSSKKKTRSCGNGPVLQEDVAPTLLNFRRFISKRNKYLSEEDVAVSDSNWTFGQFGDLQNRGKQYASDLMLSDKKKSELMAKDNILGEILMSNSNNMRRQMKSSDSGNSNFSFYSTDGQIMYSPGKSGFFKEDQSSKGRVYDIKRRFDAYAQPQSKPNYNKNSKKKMSELELNRRRDMELAKMLEDDVRKRRNKEKISIRQQLHKMKQNFQSDQEDEFDDEAYFTEPKSRDDSQSPFLFTGRPQKHSEIIGIPQYKYGQFPSDRVADDSRLSHWQSSPALLENSKVKNGIRPINKGRLSQMSSPDSGACVDKWLRKQNSIDDDGEMSSSPTPALPKKERRKTNIYKQLMDIVRKEERHMQRTQNGDRDSSFSPRESSVSTCSETSSTSSYSYSDSSGAKGVPANQEFGFAPTPAFQVAFVQPYSPSKAYRPVNYRMPGLQEDKHISTPVS